VKALRSGPPRNFALAVVTKKALSMRALFTSFALLLVWPLAAFAQSPVLEPNEALSRALEATAELLSVTSRTNDPAASASAHKASLALSLAVQAMRSQPLCVPAPVIDHVTFGLFVEELKRGNRTSTLPLPFINRTLQRHVLSVNQLMVLLELVPRSADRLQLVQLASRRLIDPEAAGALYSLFSSTADQRALAMILAG